VNRVTGAASRHVGGVGQLPLLGGERALFPAAALAIVLPLFLPAAVAANRRRRVAGEASGGTLRHLLLRPVGRTRLLVAKLVAMVAYVFGAVGLVAGPRTWSGVSLFPAEPTAVTSVSGVPMSPEEFTARVVAAVGYVAVSILGVGAIALFLSTTTGSALGATLGASPHWWPARCLPRVRQPLRSRSRLYCCVTRMDQWVPHPRVEGTAVTALGGRGAGSRVDRETP
jgi:ABC-2 type transport system permease protein